MRKFSAKYDKNIKKLKLPKSSENIYIEVESSGFDGDNFAKIKIDNDVIHVSHNENENDRGLHIVVVDPETKVIELSKAFDTYKSSSSLESFIDQQELIEANKVVIAACKDECSS